VDTDYSGAHPTQEPHQRAGKVSGCMGCATVRRSFAHTPGEGPKKKLALRLDALRVDSFATLDMDARRGISAADGDNDAADDR
jgi:hypothetical protein